MPWYLRLRESPHWGGAIVALLLIVITWVTYRSGGSSTAFPHLFYLPIILAAFLHHHWGGLIVGVVAGILCGPIMPADTRLGLMQPVDNWTLRLIFFAAIGALTGTLTRNLINQLSALRKLNAETVLAFVRAIDAKDPYTANHSLRVAEYATAIAEAMGLPYTDVDRIKWAALLHDIGKLAVPGSILRKQSSLSAEEWAVIQEHPIKSVEIIRGITSYSQYIPGVRQHHERVDGTGYPEGVKGKELCIDARIIAVADAFEAMTSKRPYRDAMLPHEALKRIRECSGTQFDPKVVEALERAWSQDPERFMAVVPSLR